MKLEENMFARTNGGVIFKIQCITSGGIVMSCGGNDYQMINIKKASYDIIDLIEVGDYVNGMMVDDIYNQNNELLLIQDSKNDPFFIFKLSNDDIKSVITREQFEAMKYEVK